MPKQKTLQKLYRRTKRGIKTLHLKTMTKKAKIAELKTLSKNGLLDLIILICEMLKKNIHNPHIGKKEMKFSRLEHLDTMLYMKPAMEKLNRELIKEGRTPVKFVKDQDIKDLKHILKNMPREDRDQVYSKGLQPYIKRLRGTVKVKGKTKYLNNKAGKEGKLKRFRGLAKANVKRGLWTPKKASQAIQKTKRTLGIN